ncbi:hypothetical protein EMCRGX_G009180 [Ephydatia muelleri]
MEAFAIPNIEAVTVAEAFVFKFVSQFGVPDFIHTDQGRNFESALMCTLLGVSKTRISPYDPKSDGLIERFNRTLLSLLSMATRQDEQNWDLHLPLVMLAYRTNVQESTGCTPLNMHVFGREARLPVDDMYGLPPQTSPTEVNQFALDLRLRMEKAYRQVREHMGLQHEQQKELITNPPMVIHSKWGIWCGFTVANPQNFIASGRDHTGYYKVAEEGPMEEEVPVNPRSTTQPHTKPQRLGQNIDGT